MALGNVVTCDPARNGPRCGIRHPPAGRFGFGNRTVEAFGRRQRQTPRLPRRRIPAVADHRLKCRGFPVEASRKLQIARRDDGYRADAALASIRRLLPELRLSLSAALRRPVGIAIFHGVKCFHSAAARSSVSARRNRRGSARTSRTCGSAWEPLRAERLPRARSPWPEASSSPRRQNPARSARSCAGCGYQRYRSQRLPSGNPQAGPRFNSPSCRARRRC